MSKKRESLHKEKTKKSKIKLKAYDSIKTQQGLEIDEKPQKSPDIFSNPKIKLLLFLLLICSSTILSVFVISDEDIWWHLKTGEWILENHSLPKNDLFTYTIPPETRWFDMQWFFQGIAELTHRIGGWNALIGLRIIWVWIFATALWLFLQEQGVPAIYSFFSALFVIINCRYRFTIRPELLTFPLLTLQLWLYTRSVNKGKLFIIPLLLIQLFWANWHSSCILGIFVASVFVLDQYLSARASTPLNLIQGITPKRRINATTTYLIIYLIAFLIITLLNPNGWRTPLYALTESKKLYILEFQPPTLEFFVGASGLILILSLLGWRKFFEKKSIFLITLSSIFLFQSLRMYRFFPYLVICLAPISAEGLLTLKTKLNSIKYLAIRVPSFIIVSLVIVSALLFNIKNDERPVLSTGVNVETFPQKAVDFVIKENIHGRLYNEFGTGGYLLWRLYPERKVFIFGETRLNEPTLEKVMNIENSDEWRTLFDEYKITYAIINCAGPPLKAPGVTVPKLISYWNDWKLIFWDDKAMVFVKDIPEYKDLITRRACRVFPEDIPFRNNPVTNIPQLELLAKDTTQWENIRRELLRAIDESPYHFRAALALGILMEMRKDDPQEILKAFHTAEKIDPESPELLQSFARLYFNQGNFDEAIKYTQKAMKYGLDKVEGMMKIATVQFGAERYSEALDTVNKILRIQPDHTQAKQLCRILKTEL